MQLHHLRRNRLQRRARRVGRGGKRGTYSGRGIKGQHARAGAKFRPEERDIIKKIPKLRGYRFKPFRAHSVAVNLDTIERFFAAGEIVSPDALLKKKIIRRIHGKTPRVKILGRGNLHKRLIFKDVAFSGAGAAKLKTQNAQHKIAT